MKGINTQVPRYTSYPPAPFWEEMDHETYERALGAFAQSGQPVSLYVHIPFCKKRCLFCGCHVVLNRKEEVVERHVSYLKKECDLLARFFSKNYPLRLLHLGGGTPTHLSNAQMESLINHLKTRFAFKEDAELSIEIDARTIEDPSKLPMLRTLGFNRLSFGVQDTNEKVQRAVKRDQSLACTRAGYTAARGLGFSSICVELIYGLPFQTKKSFEHTIDDVIAMHPDRIALYSLANVPWLKPHQKAIGEENMPSPSLKLALYLHARLELMRAGYTTIGMDHFALPHDSLARARKEKSLIRCFQGYTTSGMDQLIGLGVSSIGYINNAYFQNEKKLNLYESIVDSEILPIVRGRLLSEEDVMRKWTIQALMCHFEINKSLFNERFGISFDSYFQHELSALPQELISNNAELLLASESGRLFIRNVASHFDAYYHRNKTKQFSHSI